ncbi:MAG: SDR family NAD(P)-dependent oxidoreductase [Elusimicrobiota bacterium]|nr:SDR family NAD(P)-dependent oxidoreductase [Elusimicrobiota bacterium]
MFIFGADKSEYVPVDSVAIPHDRQLPIANEYGHYTTADEIVKGMDLTGKNVVITSGYAGTGLVTTKALAGAGARVICLARDLKRAAGNLKGIPNVEIEYLDLLKPDTIDAAAEKILARNIPIHILINHAGIIATPLTRDDRGYEYQFSTNMLDHFQLTARLFPALAQANGARVINVASRGHRECGVNFDDIHYKFSEYVPMKAYGQSKTGLILFTVRLDEMAQKYNIRSFAVHPGPIPSSDIFAASRVNIGSDFQVSFLRFTAKFMRNTNFTALENAIRRPKNVGDIWKNVQQGAATSVWAAVSDNLDGLGGVYVEDCNIAVVVPNGSAAPFGVRPWALDKESAERLWKTCEEMIGVTFTIE